MTIPNMVSVKTASAKDWYVRLYYLFQIMMFANIMKNIRKDEIYTKKATKDGKTENPRTDTQEKAADCV